MLLQTLHRVRRTLLVSTQAWSDFVELVKVLGLVSASRVGRAKRTEVVVNKIGRLLLLWFRQTSSRTNDEQTDIVAIYLDVQAYITVIRQIPFTIQFCPSSQLRLEYLVYRNRYGAETYHLEHCSACFNAMWKASGVNQHHFFIGLYSYRSKKWIPNWLNFLVNPIRFLERAVRGLVVQWVSDPITTQKYCMLTTCPV